MLDYDSSSRRILNNEGDTEAFAREIAAGLSGGTDVALCGPLGAGKTTFVRHLVKALGATVPVSSPTFVLQHEYPARNGMLIEHWDVYRLRELPEELEEPCAAHVVRLVEWADRFDEWVASCHLRIDMEMEILAGAQIRRSAVISKGV